MSAHPNNYDAYLAPGIENYILSLKVAPVRFLLRLKGAQVDHDKGIDGLAKTAAHGYYLELSYAIIRSAREMSELAVRRLQRCLTSSAGFPSSFGTCARSSVTV